MSLSTLKISAIIVGIAGDLINLRGAYLLAREALYREDTYRIEKNIAKTAREHPGIPIVAADTQIATNEDAMLATLRKSAAQTRAGFGWLMAGFTMLLLQRLLDALDG